MELTKSTILTSRDKISGLEGYLVIISKIEANTHINPDIAIESCKSLIEGLCLKALSLLSDKYISSKKVQSKCENSLPYLINISFDEVFTKFVESKLTETLSKLVIETATEIKFLGISKERIKKQAVEVVGKISAIRNERGDISHGRSYPKTIESNIALAKSIVSITDGICSFMIHEIASQYELKLKEVSKLDYIELSGFNDWLDEKHAILSVKLDFSKLLYENAYDKYEEYYNEYLDIIESEKTDNDELSDIAVDDIQKISTESSQSDVGLAAPFMDDPIEVLSPENPVEVDVEQKTEVVQLVNNFDAISYWTEKRIEKLYTFAESEKVIDEELNPIIDEYLFSGKRPLRDDVVECLNEKPALKDRAKIVDALTDKIIAFAIELNELTD